MEGSEGEGGATGQRVRRGATKGFEDGENEDGEGAGERRERVRGNSWKRGGASGEKEGGAKQGKRNGLR